MKQLKSLNKSHQPVRSHQPDISRRRFIYTAISLTIAGSFLPISVVASQAKSEEKPEDKLLSILNSRASAILIGQTILEAPDSQLQLSNLTDSIMDNLKLSSNSLASMTKMELSARFKQQTARDFDSGHMIDASGWKLGLIEAQLCVLAAQM